MSTWTRACDVDDVEPEDVIGVTLAGRAIALYRSPDGDWFATDGLCTHEKVLLADGFVMGNLIECPKHNGRFDYRNGQGMCAPITKPLHTYPVKVEGGAVYVELTGAS